MLVPTLSPGGIVIKDNLGSHKSPAGRNAVRREAVGGKLLFLPPYSPDLSPIEQVFAKIQSTAPPRRRTHRRGNVETHRNAAHRSSQENAQTTLETQDMHHIR